MTDARHLEALRARHDAGDRLKYVFFWGHRPSKDRVTSSCFSQWFEVPFGLNLLGFALMRIRDNP